MTTNNQHTPGPWSAGGFLDGAGPIICNRALGAPKPNYDVAYICEASPFAEGNALLISAAPDLLFALQKLTSVVDDPESGDFHEALVVAKAAITLATTHP